MNACNTPIGLFVFSFQMLTFVIILVYDFLVNIESNEMKFYRPMHNIALELIVSQFLFLSRPWFLFRLEKQSGNFLYFFNIFF